MDQAFLLPAVHGIVAGVEIADEDAVVAGQHLPYDGRLSGGRQPEEHMLAVGEDPDVLVSALDVDLGFVDVNEGARQELLDATASSGPPAAVVAWP